MLCETCKGSGRKSNGYFIVQCDSCSGTGKLTVDDIWKMRNSWAYAVNARRHFEWKLKCFKLRLRA